MNEIIPRIDRAGNGRVTIVGRTLKHSNMCSRSGHSVIPRLAGRGGVSAGVVLSNSGIARGGLVRVTAYNPDKERKGIEEAARRKAAKAAEERRKEAIIAEAAKRAAVKIVSKEEKPRYISGHGFRVDDVAGNETESEGMMSQKEKNLADLLEAAQEVKPIVDEKVKEEEPKADEAEIPIEEFPALKAAEIEEAEGRTAEEPKVEERGVIIPELPLVESHVESNASMGERPRKKKRGQKGRRARAAMKSDEQETL